MSHESDHPQEIDEYELVDPVDILSPLDKSGFWDGVVSVYNKLLQCARILYQYCIT